MISRSLMAASTKPILLNILLDGEDYGYNIIQKVKALSGGALEWADSMIYRHRRRPPFVLQPEAGYLLGLGQGHRGAKADPTVLSEKPMRSRKP